MEHIIKIKGFILEDFVNYKKPSMLIIFPNCTFKCEKECGSQVCQNSTLAQIPTVEATAEKLTSIYISNHFTSAIVCAGLEPFDSFDELLTLIKILREQTNDDIVIYTGYKEEEIEKQIKQLSIFKNIYIKFGRFVPNQQSHYDEVLGVNLASDNQYGKKVS